MVGLEQVGVTVNGEYVSNLRFADYVAFQSNSADELQSLINALDKQSTIEGLKITTQKTKEMVKSSMTAQRFEVAAEALEVVSEYMY